VKVLWATDVHLTAADVEVVEVFCTSVNGQSAEALLLGGDVAEAPVLVEWLSFLAERIDIPIYFVLGNHDYYGSSVSDVRDQMRRLDNPRLKWLPDVGVANLGEGIALVGHGGWGDARWGNFSRSPVILTDYIAIRDLGAAFDLDLFDGNLRNQGRLKKALGELGKDAAESLRPFLAEAVAVSRQVIVLNHVPPFREACWHDGRISDDNWLPGFTCKAMGDLLAETAMATPECDITVLCGHTHGTGVADILPNLRAFTGEAQYGRVDFKVVEIDDRSVRVT
jgi:predicted phosphohydrolase